MNETPPTPIEALLSIQFDCEMALKDGGYDGVVPTIHETAKAALAGAGVHVDLVSPAAEPRHWREDMRESYPDLCWCFVIDAEGKSALCIRDRGHDGGTHEPDAICGPGPELRRRGQVLFQPDDSEEGG